MLVQWDIAWFENWPVEGQYRIFSMRTVQLIWSSSFSLISTSQQARHSDGKLILTHHSHRLWLWERQVGQNRWQTSMVTMRYFGRLASSKREGSMVTMQFFMDDDDDDVLWIFSSAGDSSIRFNNEEAEKAFFFSLFTWYGQITANTSSSNIDVKVIILIRWVERN